MDAFCFAQPYRGLKRLKPNFFHGCTAATFGSPPSLGEIVLKWAWQSAMIHLSSMLSFGAYTTWTVLGSGAYYRQHSLSRIICCICLHCYMLWGANGPKQDILPKCFSGSGIGRNLKPKPGPCMISSGTGRNSADDTLDDNPWWLWGLVFHPLPTFLERVFPYI